MRRAGYVEYWLEHISQAHDDPQSLLRRQQFKAGVPVGFPPPRGEGSGARAGRLLAKLGGGTIGLRTGSPHPGLLSRFAPKRAALPTRGRERCGALAVC